MNSAVTIVMLTAFLSLLPLHALCESVTWTCRYATYADKEGIHKSEGELKLVFRVDSSTETAKIVSNDGKTEASVDMMYSPSGGLSFVEKKSGADVLTTSIDKNGRSVHSKNVIVDGQIAPAQFYGRCTK
jgi:lauroyl/myristoyl acyltransferase